MKLLVFTFQIFAALKSCWCIDEKLQVLTDFVHAHFSPKKLDAHFCRQSDAVQFMKMMAYSGFAIAVSHDEFDNDGAAPQRIVPYVHPNQIIYVVDECCLDKLQMTHNDLIFSSPYTWVLLRDNDVENLDVRLTRFPILTDSDFSIITTSDSSWNVQYIYKHNISSEIYYEDIGNWDRDNGFLYVRNFERRMSKRRNDLKGNALRTCLVITHNSTYKHLLDKRLKHIDTIAKVNYVFMLHITDMLNATMDFTYEDTWGYKDNRSQWTGMIGELTRKQADIGGTPLFLTSDRVLIIDYISMTTPTKSKFVFRQPKLSYITNVFTLPFTSTVWTASLLLVILIVLAMYFVVKWEWYRQVNIQKKARDGHITHDSLVEVCFMAISAVCQQGTSSVPDGIPGRMIMIVMFISLMFLYTSYSANIVALLQSASTSIRTLQDLLDSRIQVGVDDTVFNHFYFPNATESIRRRLYLQKVAPPGQKPRFYSIEEGVRRIRQGLFAFHMETGAGYKIVVETFLEDEKCGLEEIQFLQVPDPWMAIQKNSSFKELLKLSLRKIHESGIQNREVHSLYTRKPECTSRGGSTFVGVSIVDCYPAALIFVGGLILSVAILLVEVYYHYRRSTRVVVLKKNPANLQAQTSHLN